MNIIFLGAPGSGKGTQAQKVALENSICHISTGEVLRKEIACGSDLGKTVQEILKKGELVSNELVLDLLRNFLDTHKECKKGFILDGFPRNIEQAEQLDNFLLENKTKIDYVILLKVEDNIIIDRLSNRLYCTTCSLTYNKYTNPPQSSGICDKCGNELIIRNDDRPETVKTRLNIYHSQTEPLIEYYKKKGLLVGINGNQEPENILSEILGVLQ